MQFFERPLGDGIITTATATAIPRPAPSRCDPQLTTQHGHLYARVVTDILAAQAAIAAGSAVQSGTLFQRLAQESRDLGTVQGQIDACTKPTSSTVAKLTKIYKTNLQEMILMEARFSQSWLDRDFRAWMTFRTSIQERHRIVAKYAAWVSQAQAAAPPMPNLTVSTVVNANSVSTPGAVTVVDVPGSPSGPDMSVSDVVPIYKRPVVWLTALGVAAGIAGIGFFARR